MKTKQIPSMSTEKGNSAGLAASAREKIESVAKTIGSDFFLGMPDRNFGGLSPTLAVTIMTAITNGSQILYGNYGRGKTSLAETATSLMFGLPLSVVRSTEARGSDQVAPESYIATPVMTNLDRIRWKPFALMPVKIFDEFNRLPERAQVYFLDGADRGVYEYGGISLMLGRVPFYATANWPDSANFNLIPPLIDRINCAVVVTAVNPAQEIGKGARDIGETDIDNREISEQMLGVLSNLSVGPGESASEGYAKVTATLDELSSRFKALLRNIGLNPPEKEEIAAARDAIMRMPTSKEALGFNLFVSSEFTCPNCGEKTPENHNCAEACHYHKQIRDNEAPSPDKAQGYAFSHLTKHVSSRVTDPVNGALQKYSAAYAWLLGDEMVKPEHIETMLPYVLWHRVGFTESFAAANSPTTTNGRNLNLHLAEVMAGQMLRRYIDGAPDVMKVMDALAQGDGKALEDLLRHYDHPIVVHARNLLAAITK